MSRDWTTEFKVLGEISPALKECVESMESLDEILDELSEEMQYYTYDIHASIDLRRKVFLNDLLALNPEEKEAFLKILNNQE